MLSSDIIARPIANPISSHGIARNSA